MLQSGADARTHAQFIWAGEKGNVMRNTQIPWSPGCHWRPAGSSRSQGHCAGFGKHWRTPGLPLWVLRGPPLQLRAPDGYLWPGMVFSGGIFIGCRTLVSRTRTFLHGHVDHIASISARATVGLCQGVANARRNIAKRFMAVLCMTCMVVKPLAGTDSAALISGRQSTID